jgi:hypothetical protein
MHVFDALAERRIREAQQRGEFDGLPGTGRPLDLADDTLVPEELRVAYRMLKNAGFVPPELEAHGEIRELQKLVECACDDGERRRLISRIRFLLSRTSLCRRDLRIEQDYLEKIGARLANRAQ